MIPIRDTIPSRSVAWITRLLIAANIVAFAYELKQGRAIDQFLYQFGVVPAHWQVSAASDFLDWPGLFLSLVTFQFLHGGFLHLGSNMLYLWIFGDNVEDRLGHARFLLLYLSGGIASAVAQMLMSPHSSIPLVGASGAIAAVLGAYLLLFPTAKIITLVPVFIFLHAAEIPAFIFLGIWFLLQWGQGMVSIGEVADAGGVAFWAHIGGFIAGMAGTLLLRPRRRW